MSTTEFLGRNDFSFWKGQSFASGNCPLRENWEKIEKNAAVIFYLPFSLHLPKKKNLHRGQHSGAAAKKVSPSLAGRIIQKTKN